VPPNPEDAGPPYEPGPWPEGIFGEEEADFPIGLGFDFNSIWRSTLLEDRLLVYAGSRADTPAEGIILAMKYDPRTGSRAFTTLLAPVEGPVRIEAATGAVLSLSSETTGEQFLFDASANVCLPSACMLWELATGPAGR
jgi:hypothetical protein